MALTTATPAPAFAAAGEARPSERVLFNLLAPDLHSRWLARSARGFAWLLTLYACLPFTFFSSDSPPLADLAIKHNLIVLSWLAGIAALVVAAPERDSRVASIVRLRGISPATLTRVEWAVACSVPFRVLAPQCFVLSGMALVKCSSLHEALRQLLVIAGVGCYALFAAGMLGLTALWSRRLSRTRGRSLFLLITLLPLLLAQPLQLQSIPGVLSDALDLCLGVGDTT